MYSCTQSTYFIIFYMFIYTVHSSSNHDQVGDLQRAQSYLEALDDLSDVQLVVVWLADSSSGEVRHVSLV